MILALGVLPFLSCEAQAESYDDSIKEKTGVVNYTVTGAGERSGSNAANLAIEWDHYWRKDFSMFMGYRTMTEESGRSQYQAVFGGFRLFTGSLGVPVRGRISNDYIIYDFAYKPYIEVGGSVGRYLIASLNQGLLEYSTEFFGFLFGGGMQLQVFDEYAIDLNLGVEQLYGHSSPLAFGATHTQVMLGIIRQF